MIKNRFNPKLIFCAIVVVAIFLLPNMVGATDPGLNMQSIDGSTFHFNLSLTTQPTDDVTISPFFDPTTTSSPATPSFIFTSTTWDVAQPITFSPARPDIYQGGPLDAIALWNAQSSDSNYNSFPALVVSDYVIKLKTALSNVLGGLAGIISSITLPDSNNTTKPDYFSAAHNLAWGGGFVVSSGDFNGDGLKDIFLIRPTDNFGVQVEFNNGDGTFRSGSILGSQASTSDSSQANGYVLGIMFGSVNFADVSDFNGDGRDDILFISPEDSSATIFSSDDSGSLSLVKQLGTSTIARQTLFGDFNGDSKVDVVISHSIVDDANHKRIDIFLGDGHGEFSDPIASDYACADNNGDESTLQILAGDFTGDGRTDLIINCSNNNGDNPPKMLISLGDGLFSEEQVYEGDNISLTSVLKADFNNDHKLDLLIPGALGASANIYMGNGDGTFREGVSYMCSLFSSGFSVGDFNGDGWVDFTVNPILRDRSILYRNNGDGTFTIDSYYPVMGISNMLIDLFGHGYADLISSGALDDSGNIDENAPVQLFINNLNTPYLRVSTTPTSTPARSSGGISIIPSTPPTILSTSSTPALTVSHLSPSLGSISSSSGSNNSGGLSLSFNVTGAIQMAISDTSDFDKVSWQPYQSTVNYYPASGTSKIYIKFRSADGGETAIQALDLMDRSTSNSISPNSQSLSSGGYKFTKIIKINSVGADVKQLQIWLNKHGYPVAKNGPGSLGKETTKFGRLTHQAVLKFQKANKLKQTGYVDKPTLNKLNSIK